MSHKVANEQRKLLKAIGGSRPAHLSSRRKKCHIWCILALHFVPLSNSKMSWKYWLFKERTSCSLDWASADWVFATIFYSKNPCFEKSFVKWFSRRSLPWLGKENHGPNMKPDMWSTELSILWALTTETHPAIVQKNDMQLLLCWPTTYRHMH